MAMIGVLTIIRKIYVEPAREGKFPASLIMQMCDGKNGKRSK